MTDFIVLTGPLVHHESAIPLPEIEVVARPSRVVSRTSDGEDALKVPSTETNEAGEFSLELVHSPGLRYYIEYHWGRRVVTPYVLDCDSWPAGSAVTIADLPPIAGVPPSAVEDLQAWFLEHALPGVPGPSAYDVAVAEGFPGSEQDWLDSLVSTVPGPPPTIAWDGDALVVEGVEGPPLTGPASTVPGPPNSLAIGTITTGIPGSSADADITGTPPSQTLDLTIPRGDVGPPNSLTVGTVTTGAPGSSADADITGAAPSQTLDLVIPRGDKGDKGDPSTVPGPANTLTVGTVTTVSPATPASVTITGTSPEQVLNLALPKGDPGGWVNTTNLPPATDLNTLTTPGLYFINGTAGNTVALGYPADEWSGFVEVVRAAASAVMQRATAVSLNHRGSVPSSRGVYARAMYGVGNWLAWQRIATAGEPGGSDLTGTGMPNGVVPALPGTYYTDTAGTNGAWRWLKKSGTGNTGWECIVGDTGRRHIQSLLVNGATQQSTDWCYVRREGNRVQVYLCINFPAWTSGGVYLTIPEGFRATAAKTIYLPASFYSGGNEAHVLNSTGTLQRFATSATAHRITWTWDTDNAWPTTLPGTPN